MAGFEIINVDVDDDVKGEMQADFDEEAAFDRGAAFDVEAAFDVKACFVSEVLSGVSMLLMLNKKNVDEADFFV